MPIERTALTSGARVGLLLLFLTIPAMAQPTEPPKYEFRGAWVTTVFNLDWPVRGATTEAQKAALLELMDGLAALGINAVFFQVRPESDTFYASPVEPWSYWLTGTQGQPPDPFYDPLSFAVTAAHERGMELHAWFNPFRALSDVDTYTPAPSHVTVQHPEWILAPGDIRVLDPGLPEVRDHITGIITAVAERYDIDGVHFDDYFYPAEISIEDFNTYDAHGRGIDNVGDWRRDNVNLFIEQVHDSLNVVKPWLKFGVSPFGIWKNGVPDGIVGQDAYNVLYADATAWLSSGTIDYLVPQLYWAFGGGQDYAKLAPWWADQAGGRHIYVGHGLYKADPATWANTLFAPDEVPSQVRFNRTTPGVQGSAFFRASNLTTLSSQGFADTLQTDLFRYPALTPPMDWKDFFPPGAPTDLAATWTGDETVSLSWTPAPPGDDFTPEARRYAVYRVASDDVPDIAAAVADARNLLAVTGTTSVEDQPAQAATPYHYFVTAVSANSIEGVESNVVTVEGRAVAVEGVPQPAFALAQNYPNPFTGQTTIRYALERPGRVSLRVFNVLGQEVAALVADQWTPAGQQEVRWDAEGLVSGTYFVQIDVDGRRATRGMVLRR